MADFIKNVIFVAFVILLMLLAISVARADYYCEEPITECLWENFDNSVVRIEFEGADKGVGSGVYLSPDFVLTNFHVIELFLEAEQEDEDGDTDPHRSVTETVWIRNGLDGKPSQASILGWEEESDLAILWVETNPDAVYAPIFDDSIPRGAVVYTAGYPSGVFQMVTQGHFQGIQHGDLIYDATIENGNSGGALFYAYDEKIYLLGITSWNWGTSGAMGIAATHINGSPTTTQIKDFLSEYEFFLEG